MRERRSRRARPADPLARLFLEVSGTPPDDASLLRMRRVSAALNLRDNDALWSVLAVLEYYVRLYEAMPERIRQAGAGGVDAARAEALVERGLRLDDRAQRGHRLDHRHRERLEPGHVVVQAPVVQQRGVGVDADAERAALGERRDEPGAEAHASFRSASRVRSARFG